MVILFLRHFTNPVGEVQRLPKIVEPILLLEMMLVDDRPSPIQRRNNASSSGPFRGGTPPRHGTHCFFDRSLIVSFHFPHD